MVSGRSRVWRFASAVARCPGTLTPRPVIRRLLTMAGIAVAGWLLGVAGHAHADQAHADTVPGARLPSVAAPVEHVTALAADVLDTRGVVPAVQRKTEESGTVLTPARPPAILALPPAVKEKPRPRTPVGSAGPSRTQRHGGAGSRAGVSGGPLIHIGPHVVTGASEKVSTDRVAHKRVPHQRVHAPSAPRRPLPQRGQVPPSSAGGDGFGGFHPAGVRRRTEPVTALSRPAIPILRTGVLPPVVRTAADEPSFSPD
ncbi:hypothetical protein [Actinoallomurus iriomotensis]|uniref:Uncharacterized protein n=1 Tax=Actinoallomurus iriomotensis TaxID=478107 RepID=A0A9W6S9M2_9ACTN|nr:hypothetical protein [Actinoallomurus iriomotensis]GLY88397.1 hypothetical protein Airi02_063260 [Actinoallomurus iriomotensis]